MSATNKARYDQPSALAMTILHHVPVPESLQFPHFFIIYERRHASHTKKTRIYGLTTGEYFFIPLNLPEFQILRSSN